MLMMMIMMACTHRKFRGVCPYYGHNDLSIDPTAQYYSYGPDCARRHPYTHLPLILQLRIKFYENEYFLGKHTPQAVRCGLTIRTEQHQGSKTVDNHQKNAAKNGPKTDNTRRRSE